MGNEKATIVVSHSTVGVGRAGPRPSFQKGKAPAARGPRSRPKLPTPSPKSESDAKSANEELTAEERDAIHTAAIEKYKLEHGLALASSPSKTVRPKAAPGAPPLSVLMPAVYEHYQVLLELKSSVYQVLNHKLANVDKYLDPALLMTILALARYEAFNNESWIPARAHLRGLQQMIQSRPSVDLLPHPFLHFALRWSDRVCAMFSGQEPIFEKPSNAACNPASPLVTALIPRATDLRPGQWRRIMTSFYRCPGAELINIFAKLTKVMPAIKTADRQDDLLRTLQEIQLDLLSRTPDIYEGILTFSDPRFDRQRLTFEALRRAGLLLISAAIYRLCTTITAKTDLDHTTMSLFMLDLSAVMLHSPSSALFILCIGGPCTSGTIHDGAARLLADTAGRLDLLSCTWPEILTYLSINTFYYPEIQDSTCPAFWDLSVLLSKIKIGEGENT
ncbi:hypothetical protein FH972_021785 [Carpinus fangiana]|uniref:Uncharacterized protein n=1 Tax=Carpinus fangiana TaxID=176857 RepID=A0A5N6KSF4_9ROSI|nr:hypothetical protein FH972_021785 [Carpinus fangiana]